MSIRSKKILAYLVPPLVIAVIIIAFYTRRESTPVRKLTAANRDTVQPATVPPGQEGEQYTAMIDSIPIEGQLVAQLPGDTKLRPMRIVDGKPALILENGKIVVMADGQTGQVTTNNGRLTMQLRDSSLKELTFRKDGLSVDGKAAPDARMAVMLQGKMLDVTMENGKSLVTLSDSTKMELLVNNGQALLVASTDTLRSRATRLRLPNGTLHRVRLDSGKVRLQVQPDRAVELQKKETAVSPASK